jgi:hypothetical protein
VIVKKMASQAAARRVRAASWCVAALGGAVACAAAYAALPNPEELGLPKGARASGPPPAAVVQRLSSQGLPFGPGESLRFSIEYGPVKAGTATLEVQPMRTHKGRTAYHFVSTASSAPFFDKVYRVRDRIDALVDAQRFVTLQYRKVQREGAHRAEHHTVYDHEGNRARYKDGVVVSIPPGAIDMLSAFYRTRLEKLEPGQSLYLPHHSDKKTFYLEVQVLRRERTQVPAGTFQCLVVEPLVRDAGPFRNQGKLTLWLTDDERRMPVRMESKVPVGAIAAVLIEARPGGPPLAQRGAAGDL